METFVGPIGARDNFNARSDTKFDEVIRTLGGHGISLGQDGIIVSNPDIGLKNGSDPGQSEINRFAGSGCSIELNGEVFLKTSWWGWPGVGSGNSSDAS